MRMTEQLARENQKKERKKKYSGEEEEETLCYQPYPEKLFSLNREPGVFDRKESSFHTQENVFDRTALFRTNGDIPK